MSDVINLQTSETLLKTAIEAEVSRLGNAKPLALAPRMSEATTLYVKRLQGKYNIERAKHDTDNAIDLLSIAYNTTPQDEPDIRNRIRSIMTQLIRVQRDSQVAMQSAITVAEQVQTNVGMDFDVWSEVRPCESASDTDGVKKIKDYVSVDLLALAKDIEAHALEVKAKLEVVATTYDRLIADTSAATAASETALGKRLHASAALTAQINKSKARRLSLDEQVKELAAQVQKYEKKANDFAVSAATDEERAFIMSIVQVGAQMVSAAIPAIVTALTASATGGASVVAAAAANTISRAVGDKNPTAKPDPTDADLIKTQKELSEKTSEAKSLAASIGEQKTGIKVLEDELKAKQDKKGKSKDVAVAAAVPAAGASPAKPAAAAAAGAGSAEPVAPAAVADSTAVTSLKNRLAEKRKNLKADEDKYEGLIGALSGLQASLVALDKGLGELSKKAEKTASGLREMQMKMLDKVETYEKERRSQNAELVEITALLSGHLTEQETMQLTIQCLNVSQSALKRTQEIITEIAAFFTSFAAFMGQIAEETKPDVRFFEKMASRVSLLALVARTDKFFLRVGAEWHAVAHVAGRFSECFADGHSKLNKLSGQHLYDAELKAYLVTAKELIETIVHEREAAADGKVAELKGYRAQLIDSAIKAA